MKEWDRKYFRRFWAGMIGYVIILPLSLVWLQSGRVIGGYGRFIIAALPVIPFVFAMWASVNNIQKMDELQRRIHFEAVLITVLATGALSFTYGLLEVNQLVPQLPTIFIAPFMIACWGIAAAFVRRKYD